MRITIFFSIASIARGSFFELPLWHDDEGSYSVDARATNCNPAAPRRFPMKVKLYDFSVVEERYSGCEVSLPALSEREIRFREGFRSASYLVGSSILGIGPGSSAANDGVDIVVSGGLDEPAILRMGSSLAQFQAVCYPGTQMVVPTQRAGAISDILARFDFVDASTGVFFNTTRAPERVELEFVAQHSLAAFPEPLASRLEDFLIAGGATRMTTSDSTHWSYSNCTFTHVPNLLIEFHDDENGVVGAIQLTPDEFMPECEFHVAEEGLLPALDIFKLPYINKRIENNEIYLCDPTVAM